MNMRVGRELASLFRYVLTPKNPQIFLNFPTIYKHSLLEYSFKKGGGEGYFLKEGNNTRKKYDSLFAEWTV